MTPQFDRCTRYAREQSRQCRNKVFQGHLCRRHVIEDLRRYEHDNARLLWYLNNRYLLEETHGKS